MEAAGGIKPAHVSSKEQPRAFLPPKSGRQVSSHSYRGARQLRLLQLARRQLHKALLLRCAGGCLLLAQVACCQPRTCHCHLPHFTQWQHCSLACRSSMCGCAGGGLLRASRSQHCKQRAADGLPHRHLLLGLLPCLRPPIGAVECCTVCCHFCTAIQVPDAAALRQQLLQLPQ